MIPIYILAIENDDDRTLIENIYIKYHRLMFSKIKNIVKDSHVAEDILQTALENLIKKIDTLRTLDKQKLASYVTVTATNAALTYKRNKNRHPEFPFDESFDLPDNKNDRADMERKLIKECDLKTLARIWEKVPENHKYILTEKFILGKSTKDIAKDLNCPPGSVRMAITRARAYVFSMIEKENNAEHCHQVLLNRYE